MSRLLRANFVRLWKSKVFWLGIAFQLGMGIVALHTQYQEKLEGYQACIDDVIFSSSIFMPVVAAVFVGLFVGTEYSDGTIRNKLIVGHSRMEIYLSNLIVCTIALFLMHLAYIAVMAGAGIPLLRNFDASASELVKIGLISLVTIMALGGLFVMMSMLIHSKSNGSVTAIIVGIVLLMSAMVIMNGLNEPEYWEAYTATFVDESGQAREEHVEKQKNPNYIGGTRRKVYEFLYDFLPGCQMTQISSQSIEHPVRLPLYSASILLVTTACGVFAFRKKNIK